MLPSRPIVLRGIFGFILTTLFLFGWFSFSPMSKAPPSAQLFVESAEITELGSGGHQLRLKGVGLSAATQVSVSTDLTNQHQILRTIRTWQSQFSVDANDQIAVIADNKNGLQILDLTVPSAPIIHSSLPVPGRAVGVKLHGNLAFVGCADAGLTIVDLSNSTFPKIIGRLDTPGYAGNLQIKKNSLFLADGTAGVQVIDISDPTDPELQSNIPAQHFAWDVAFHRELLLVADGTNGVVLARYTPGAPPKVLSRAPTLGLTFTVLAKGDTLYAAGADMPLQIWDIQQPENPQLLHQLDIGLRTNALATDGDRLYASTRLGLKVYEFSDQDGLVLVGEIQTDTGLRNGILRGNIVYATGFNQFYVLDVSTLKPLPQRHRLNLGKQPQMRSGKDIFYLIEGRRLFAATYVPEAGFSIHKETTFPMPLRSMNLHRNALYLTATNNALYQMDLTVPEAPLMMARAELKHLAAEIDVNSELIAVAGKRELSLLNQKSLLSHSQTSIQQGDIQALAFKDHWLYVACEKNGLLVLDTTNPVNPIIVNHLKAPWPESTFASIRTLILKDDILYLANHELGLVALDVSTPHRPAPLGSLQLSGIAYDLSLSGQHAVVQHSNSCLSLVDISNPTQLRWMGDIPGTARAIDFVMKHGRIFLTDNNGEFFSLTLPLNLSGGKLSNGILEIPLPANIPKGILDIQVNNYNQGQTDMQRLFLQH